MNNLLDQSADQLKADPNKNYVEELVGEGKKFRTVEDLARGKFESDLHIDTLQRRMDELREDYKKIYEQSTSAPKLQDLLEKLEKLDLPASRNAPLSNEDTKTAALDAEQLELLATKKAQEVYERNEATRKQTENFNLVQSKIKEAFGDNFASALKQRADSLGLTDVEVNTMARTNPNLFFKTFDVGTGKTQETFQSPPVSALLGYTPPKNQKRTLSYYQELRKKDPMIYYDPKIAVQMDKDAQALGKDFFDV